MILYTVQPKSIYTQLMDDGVFHSRPQLDPVSWYGDGDWKIRNSYHWLIRQMESRGLTRPAPDVLPIWAYVRWAGTSRPRPDLRNAQIRSWGSRRRMVLLTLEVPSESVLELAYDGWLAALSYVYLGNQRTIERFQSRCRRLGVETCREEPYPEPLHSEIESSWERLFDLEKSRSANRESVKDQTVQAVFWETRKEQVVKAVEFGLGSSSCVLSGH